MAIPTSRTKEKAHISIIEKRCTGCGMCVEVCKDFSLIVNNNKVAVSENPLFGCTGCGHCMAICPEDAIRINGRGLTPDDLFELPSQENAASYHQLLSLIQRRRSIREYNNTPIDNETIQKILKAARTAPMGLPPSDVNVLILDSQKKVTGFAKDFCEYLEGIKWITSGWFLTLMKPFWGKANDEMFRNFVRPLFDTFIKKMKNGENVITYDAPLAMYFYGSPWCDPADPLIAATYAMIAAESLGLGTCMIGSVHPLIQSGNRAKKFREKHGIKNKSREGLIVIFGFSKVKYEKGIYRTFATEEIKS